MADARVNDLDQELFSELTEPLVQPLRIHVVPPFADVKDPTCCLQINGNVSWEWRTLEGNLKKLYALLQRNQRLNGYLLEESAINRVFVLLSTKTKTFVGKIKKENKEKRRRRKKAETWIKLFLYPAEISHSPYDILTELNEKIDQLDATVQEQAAELCAQMKEACRRIEKHQ